MELREYLEEYRALTLGIMDELKKNLDIDFLIEKREDILNSINRSNFDKQEIKELGEAMNLLESEEELQNLVKKEKAEVKKQIENLKKIRQANTNYNSIENRARVLNKSV